MWMWTCMRMMMQQHSSTLGLVAWWFESCATMLVTSASNMALRTSGLPAHARLTSVAAQYVAAIMVNPTIYQIENDGHLPELRTPEVLRVDSGSFWEEPLVYEDLAALFESEENDLMQDLRDLPRNSAVRKINELVKRARLAKVNAHIISHLKEKMPSFMGQKKKQTQLIQELGGVFR